MNNFIYYSPTELLFGKGMESRIASSIKKYGGHKVLVHYGSSSVKRSGLLDSILAQLTEAGIAYVCLGGVQPNPVLSLVREGIALAKSENVDFLLAIGGGSVIDSAKAIAYGIANECDIWDLFTGKNRAKAAAPIGVVLTIAAAGSESSNSAVITNEDGMHKKAYNDNRARPTFAVMNPEWTFTLPPYQTACGIADILMHTMERYFTPAKDVELTTRIAESLLITVMHHAAIVMEKPDCYESRAEIMLAGSLSHNDLTGLGKEGDFASHRIEHELSGMFDVAHGAGLTAVWGSWARYVMHKDVATFAQFAVRVVGVEMDYYDLEGTALKGIAGMEQFFLSIGMPTGLAGLEVGDVTDAQIDDMANRATLNDTVTCGSFMKLNRADVKRIYELARAR